MQILYFNQHAKGRDSMNSNAFVAFLTDSVKLT